MVPERTIKHHRIRKAGGAFAGSTTRFAVVGMVLILTSCSQPSTSHTPETTNPDAPPQTTVAEVDDSAAADTEIPSVVFDSGFTPANLDLSSSLEVRFVNGSGEDIVITFDSDDLPDVALPSGGEAVVSFEGVALDIYRFHTYVGSVKLPGTVDSRYYEFADGGVEDLATTTLSPPDALYFSMTKPITDVREFGVSPLGQEAGIAAIRLQVPAGWTDVSFPGRDAYLFVRDDDPNDPASVLFRPTYKGASIADEVGFISEQAGVAPETRDAVTIRGQDWAVYHWSPDDLPHETLFARESSGFVSIARLSSAPEDHSMLYETVLVPMLGTYELVFTEE